VKQYEKYLNENERKAVALFASRTREYLGANLIDFKIFGSKVRGDFDQESDIDILLIVKHRDAQIGYTLSSLAAALNLELDCVLAPIVYTEREYKRNCYFKTLFTATLAQEGIAL